MRLGICLGLVILMSACNMWSGDVADYDYDYLRTDVADARHAQQAAETELEILQGRINKQEDALATMPKQVETRLSSIEKQLTALKSQQERALADLRELNKVADSNRGLISKHQGDLETLQGQLTTNVAQIKGALGTIMDLAQKGESSAYKVRPGDSLDKIAQLHHTTVKAIKERNQLSSDRIFPNQELIIP